MADIYCETTGSGEDLVLIHGWSMHSGMWGEFAEQLAKVYRVTCVDLPGHGHSELNGKFELEAVSRAVIEQAPNSAHWIGWSLGATITLNLLKQYPQSFKSLVMIAGNAKFVAAPDWPTGIEVHALKKFLENLKKNKSVSLERFLALQIINLSNRKLVFKDMKDRLARRPLPKQVALSGGIDILRLVDFRDLLSMTGTPAMLMLGEMDTLVPIEVGAAMKAICPQLRVNSIIGAGHMPFFTHPTESVSLVRRFIDNRVD